MGAVKSTLAINDGMTPALRHINKAMSLMLNNFNAVQRASGNAIDTKDLAIAKRELGKANDCLDEIEQNYADIGRKQDAFNSSVSRGSSAMGGLWNKLKGVAGAYLGIQGAKAMVGLSDNLTGGKARMKMLVDIGLGDSAGELDTKIFQSAQNARANYTDVMSTVTKLGLVAGEAFSSDDELIKFTELLNKNFVVGGASATEQASAMYQLTQAMGSGRLQGDEYRSIIENAPLLAKSIEDYMRNVRKVKGSMKEWAAEGLLTADVIKAATFDSAKDVEERFAEMPKTWSQVWTNMKNDSIKALDPIIFKIGNLADSPRIQQATDLIVQGVSLLSRAASVAFGWIGDIANAFINNWGWIAPIIGGITVALGLYGAALLINKAYLGLITASKIISTMAALAHKEAIDKEQQGLLGATAAQQKFNMALLKSPLTWVLLIIIAIIAAVYAVVGIINKVTNKSISATGVILGSLSAAGAFIWNLFLGILEMVLGVINYMINPFVEIANFIGNVFTNPVSSIIYLFQGMADNVLAMLQKIASGLDYVFGSNMADTVQGWRDSLKGKADEMVQKYAPEENYKDVISNVDLSVEGLGLKRIEYSDAYLAGYKLGEKVDDKLGNMLSFESLTKGAEIPSMSDNIEGISDDTTSLSDSVDTSSEELEYLRDIAEREAVNRFTTAEVKVDFNNNNSITSDVDVDGVISRWTEEFKEAVSTAAEGDY